MNYDGHRRALQRAQSFPIVGTSDVQIAGPKPGRRALLIGTPLPLAAGGVSDSTLTAAADSSTTGVKSLYTVPAGGQATLVSATMDETTGTTVVAALEIKRGATVIALGRFTKVGIWSAPVVLQAGDIVQWDVVTAVALSVTDFAIFVSRERSSRRVTLSFVAPAVLDVGLTLYGGTLPLYLHDDMIGSAITEEIHAIGSEAGIQLSVLDVFEA